MRTEEFEEIRRSFINGAITVDTYAKLTKGFKPPRNHVIPNVAEVCDHCDEKVEVLWQDDEHWLLCPDCWPLYHNYQPK